MRDTNVKTYAYFGVITEAAVQLFGRKIVKIGYSIKPPSRLSGFGSDLFDWHESFVLVTKGRRDGLQLEKTLHNAFRKSRIPSDQIPFGATGRGEWYEFQVIDELRNFLKQHDATRTITLERNYFYAHAQGVSDPSRFSHVTPASKQRDIKSAARLHEALNGLMQVASLVSVGASPASPGLLQLHVKTIHNPVLIQRFKYWLDILRVNAHCWSERTPLIDEFLEGETSAFVRFNVIALPAVGLKMLGSQSAIERFFSKPLELMRAMTGERHTVSIELLRRNDLV